MFSLGDHQSRTQKKKKANTNMADNIERSRRFGNQCGTDDRLTFFLLVHLIGLIVCAAFYLMLNVISNFRFIDIYWQSHEWWCWTKFIVSIDRTYQKLGFYVT